MQPTSDALEIGHQTWGMMRGMARELFDAALLDRLEGLHARYGVLTRRLEQLQDQAAAFDKQPDPGEVANLEAARRQVREQVAEVLRGMLARLE
jgi:hypothetical protein